MKIQTIRWNQNVLAWKGLFQTGGRKLAKDMRREETELYNTIVPAEESLQADPANKESNHILYQSKNALRSIQSTSNNGLPSRGFKIWVQGGNKMGNKVTVISKGCIDHFGFNRWEGGTIFQRKQEGLSSIKS